MGTSRFRAPDLSTADQIAARHYIDGVAALVAGGAHTEAQFAAAVNADPLFALAHVGVAVVARREVEVPRAAPATRGERQHIEIAREWLQGNIRRADDLRREHLLEFPGDLVIVVLPLVAPSSASLSSWPGSGHASSPSRRAWTRRVR